MPQVFVAVFYAALSSTSAVAMTRQGWRLRGRQWVGGELSLSIRRPVANVLWRRRVIGYDD